MAQGSERAGGFVVSTAFARYRLYRRRDVSVSDRERIVHAFELRTLLRRWLDEESWSRSRIDAFCAALDLPPPARHDTEAERAKLIDRVTARLEGLGPVVLLREPDPARERVLAPSSGSESGEDSDEVHWIEVLVLDQDDRPAPGITYQIRLSDGRTRTGRTNQNGVLRYDDLAAGTCEIELVELDADAWEPA